MQRVFRVSKFSQTPTLIPIGGEHPTTRTKGGNKPSNKLESVASRYGSTNKNAAPGCRMIIFQRPKRQA